MKTRTSRVLLQPPARGRGTAVPLVKATLRGILPHGSEVPWAPSRSALRALTIHPAARRPLWDSSQTNPCFHRRTSGVTSPSPVPESQGAMSGRRAHTVYECTSCGERFVGVRRCPECNLFMPALGRGGVCIHCDEPLLVAELLDDGGATLLR